MIGTHARTHACMHLDIKLLRVGRVGIFKHISTIYVYPSLTYCACYAYVFFTWMEWREWIGIVKNVTVYLGSWWIDWLIDWLIG